MSPERIREFVLAGHGDLAKVQQMLAENPELLSASHVWKAASEGMAVDTESAIQAAAHVGNRAIAEFLIAKGAPLEIPTAAMLGRLEQVRQMLAHNPALAQQKGAHNIPLLPHAAFAGSVELMQLLSEYGASEGSSMALAFAAQRGHLEVVRWLLSHTVPNLGWKNFQGKTAMELANEAGHTAVVQLLQQHG